MRGLVRRCGFTLTETLAVVVILVMLLLILVPAVRESRETARRATCINNLKQLGLAFHLFHDAKGWMPPASGVTLDEKGKIAAVDGWSYVMHLLPYMDQQALYDTLDVSGGRPLAEPAGAKGAPHADARRTVLPVLICPDRWKDRWADPKTKADALSSYKVLGATHHESLSVASPTPQTPKYDPDGKHPDGACYPGTQFRLRDFNLDGAGHTALACETVEPKVARWAIGADATLVGLSPAVEYEQSKGEHYFVPRGFVDGHFDENSTVPAEYRTYLHWDYSAAPYDGGDGSAGGMFGPSSPHPGVVNHLLADGTACSINKDVDVTLYMFLLTRAAHDPTRPSFP